MWLLAEPQLGLPQELRERRLVLVLGLLALLGQQEQLERQLEQQLVLQLELLHPELLRRGWQPQELEQPEERLRVLLQLQASPGRVLLGLQALASAPPVL